MFASLAGVVDELGRDSPDLERIRGLLSQAGRLDEEGSLRLGIGGETDLRQR